MDRDPVEECDFNQMSLHSHIVSTPFRGILDVHSVFWLALTLAVYSFLEVHFIFDYRLLNLIFIWMEIFSI